MLQKYLEFAIAQNAPLKIKTKKDTTFGILVKQYDTEKIQYIYENSGKMGSVNIENVVECKCRREQDEQRFQYQTIGENLQVSDLQSKIENFKKYYLEVIEQLLSREKENSKGYFNLVAKKNVYPKMFENLYKDPENLLYYYFSKRQPVSRIQRSENEEKEVLFIEQANGSQKRAIHHALNDKISIIEGPPGTGKTTTIMNILANFVYQKKKVLIVSKNNSAIDNVVEELEKIDLPQYFIRLRKSDRYERTSRTYFKEKTRNIEKCHHEYKSGR